jgi:lysophospholipase L1-like esterase
MDSAREISSFAALGDSFTEGMSDVLPDGGYRGWADVLAQRLAARTEGFRYANLAVRGKLIGQIVQDQVAPAAALRADLVTLVGGLNDVLRPKCDVDRVCAQLEEAVATLAPSCGQLVLMRSPGRQGPVLERYRSRMEQLFAAIDELAERHGALVVDLYASRSLGDRRVWADDRLHLTGEGHRRVAEAVWQRLGHPAEWDWDVPLPAPGPGPGWGARRRADVRFARQYLLPWIGRRLTGRSSGDGRTGAHYSSERGAAFWVSAADPGAPGPVSGWRPVTAPAAPPGAGPDAAADADPAADGAAERTG